jgi:predicted ATPase
MPKNFVEQLHITSDCRCFKAGYTLDFTAPVTILVGENGTGKSTLLDLIRSHFPQEGLWQANLKEYATVKGTTPKKVVYFDFHSSDMKYAGVFGDDMETQVQSMYASSGQASTLQLHASGVLKAKNSLVLLDEVGRGYSPGRQYQMALALGLLGVHGNQVIASTHSEYVMRLSRAEGCKLYSVENQAYMSYEEFIAKHMEACEKQWQ